MQLVEAVPISVKAVALFGLMKSGVVEVREDCQTAQLILLESITVFILRMLELSVQQVSSKCFNFLPESALV